MGGDVDEADKFIEPTVIVDVSPDDPIMKEEVKLQWFCNELFIERGIPGLWPSYRNFQFQVTAFETLS